MVFFKFVPASLMPGPVGTMAMEMDKALMDWKVDNVLSKLTDSLKRWGGGLMMLTGIVMIIIGIFKIAKGLISHGKAQISWVVNIMLIVVGALFCTGSLLFDKLATNANDGLGHSLVDELDALGGSVNN